MLLTPSAPHAPKNRPLSTSSSPPPPSPPRTRTQHRVYGYRGLIVDWDPACAMDEHVSGLVCVVLESTRTEARRTVCMCVCMCGACACCKGVGVNCSEVSVCAVEAVHASCVASHPHSALGRFFLLTRPRPAPHLLPTPP